MLLQGLLLVARRLPLANLRRLLLFPRRPLTLTTASASTRCFLQAACLRQTFGCLRVRGVVVLLRVGVCVRGQPGTALAALGPTAVLSVHLDATSEEKRVRQLSNCLERARQLASR